MLDLVIDARPAAISPGFNVRRILPYRLRRMLGLFIFMDHAPLGERFIWWNFVSSRKERIEQAKADWAAGRILLPPNDNAEFVPLPQDKTRPAGSGSPPPQPLS